MTISDEMIAVARLDPINCAQTVINDALEEAERAVEYDEELFEVVQEASVFVNSIAELAGVKNLSVLPTGTDRTNTQSCQAFIGYLKASRVVFAALLNQARMSAHKKRFDLGLGSTFSYEFSQGDLDRVQTLLNELRNLIGAVDGLNEEHRQRVLASLEKLQRELHKKVSDFDRLYGLAAQLSSLMHKAGTDSKPIIDRVREMLGIAWETQARGDELPSGTEPPLLPKPGVPGKLPSA